MRFSKKDGYGIVQTMREVDGEHVEIKLHIPLTTFAGKTQEEKRQIVQEALELAVEAYPFERKLYAGWDGHTVWNSESQRMKDRLNKINAVRREKGLI